MANINKKNSAWRYGFAIILVISGLILSYLNIGDEFLGFSSVGSWLIYVGFIMLAIITLQLMSNKKRIVDERMQFVATKAARITFIGIILFAFVIMVIDGIKPINIAYSYFMSYLICGIVLLYLVSYNILLRFN
ncbi:hypothetical protein JXA12_03160 [Candidatus Woesearchaeota archaeon]|nr:hypothetical protein [Candidatus Woesearchaeota archaeon]